MGLPAGPPEPVTSRSLTDDYILVHGMAAGALSADGVTQATLDEMVRLDQAALLALGTSVGAPRSADAQSRAAGAIRKLAAYAEAVGGGAPHPAAPAEGGAAAP